MHIVQETDGAKDESRNGGITQDQVDALRTTIYIFWSGLLWPLLCEERKRKRCVEAMGCYIFMYEFSSRAS